MGDMSLALVIVDVQNGAFDGAKIPPLYAADSVLSNIKSLQDYFRDRLYPVVFIQDCGKAGGAFEAGTIHWQIHAAIIPKKDERVIFKDQPSAFDNTELENLLRENGIGVVVLAGLHSEKCLTNTCFSALDKKFKVIVASDAHSTNKQSSDESQWIIDKQNQLFEQSGAAVEKTEDLVEGKKLDDYIQGNKRVFIF